MVQRQQQSDIMSQILTASARGGDPIPVLDELTQLIRLYSSDEPQIPGQPPPPPSSPLLQRLMPDMALQKKGSYHISSQTLLALEKVTKSLRSRLTNGTKRNVSKSKIVEYAVELLIDDYERFAEQSILAKNFLNKDGR